MALVNQRTGLNAQPQAVKKPLRDLALFGVIVAGAAILFFFNPATTVFYPKCLFHEMTGLYCPGCGTTRALNHLLHGELPDALCANALVVLALPVLGFIILRRCLRRRPPVAASRVRLVWIVVLLAVVAVFGVLRNVPCRPFSWLAPPSEAARDAKLASRSAAPVP
jgi:hypothetical protein